MSVACSEHWLQVKIRRKSYVNYLQPQSYELHLGTGCPVTRELLDFFEFFYGLSSCGIKVNERPSSILIESSVTYEPVSLDIIGHIPISCYIQRPFLFTFVTKTELNTSSAFQSLVRKNNSASPKVEDTEIHPGVSFE
ncbi:oocyte-secreted protein 4A-like isoform 6-T24 [Trichechus inunguis]